MRSVIGPVLASTRAAVARRRDQRSREREQTDRKHDERAVQMSDLAHRSLPSGVSGAPVTLEPPTTRPTTGG